MPTKEGQGYEAEVAQGGDFVPALSRVAELIRVRRAWRGEGGEGTQARALRRSDWPRYGGREDVDVSRREWLFTFPCQERFVYRKRGRASSVPELSAAARDGWCESGT